MNLDSLSFALAEISYSVANLTKKNFKSTVAEISHLVATHGPEADRHLFRCLFSHVDFSGDVSRNSGKDFHQTQFLIQECNSLLNKPNFVSTLCYAIDNPLHQQKSLRPSPNLFPQISRVLKLSRVQEVVFGLSLLNSVNSLTRAYAGQFVRQKLPDLVRTYVDADSGLRSDGGGLQDIEIEVLHLLLHQLLSIKDSFGIGAEQKEAFLLVLRKDFPNTSVPVVLGPLLYPELEDQFIDKLANNNNMPKSVYLLWKYRRYITFHKKKDQMDASLADMIAETGFSCTSSVEECRSHLLQFGAREITQSSVAKVLGMMAKNPTALSDQGQSHMSWGDIGEKADKPGVNTWNVEVFVAVVQDIASHINWRDVVLELDYPGFIVANRKGLNLLVRGLMRGLQETFPVEYIYKPWKNTEGQLSFVRQALENPDVFCFGDNPCHTVVIDILKSAPDDDNRGISTWKSLDLVEMLLRLSDAGHYQQVSEMFKFPKQNCPDVLVLALLQITPTWNTLKQELISSLMPLFLGNHPNSAVVLHYAWHCQGHSSTIRTLIMHSMAEWYMRGEQHDQGRLSRILDVAQDLKALSMLLNATPFAFVIDLACLASRREYLKLDKWLSDKIREHGESFVQTCVNFLKRRCPQLMIGQIKEELIQAKSQMLPPDTVGTMLNCLKQCVSQVSQELSEAIVTMMNNAQLYMAKMRQAPAVAKPSSMSTIGQPPSSLLDPLEPPNTLGIPKSWGMAGQTVTAGGFPQTLTSLSASATPGSPAKATGFPATTQATAFGGMQNLTSQFQSLSIANPISGIGNNPRPLTSMGSGVGSLGSGLVNSLGANSNHLASGLGSFGAGPSTLSNPLGSGAGVNPLAGTGINSLGSGVNPLNSSLATGITANPLGLGVSPPSSSVSSLGNLANKIPSVLGRMDPNSGSGANSLDSSLSSLASINTLAGGMKPQQPQPQQQQQPPGQQQPLGVSMPVRQGSLGVETPSDTSQQFNKDVEDQVNSYFQRIYNQPPYPTMSIDEVLDMLKRFKESQEKWEKDVYLCMLRNLFEEYKFFPQYPERELLITAMLFGGVIEKGLAAYMDLGIALRYVLEALKKPVNTKMYFFGIAALNRFKTRLKDYPQYCQHLMAIPHFNQFPQPLMTFVEYGAKPQDSMAPSSIPMTTGLSSTLASTQSILTSTSSESPAPITTSAVQTPVTTAAVAQAKASSLPKPSIASATNIDTLLAGQTMEEVIPPSEATQDKVFFIFNNLSLSNMVQKCEEMKKEISEADMPWMAQYLVMKRASIEPNFHLLYANFVDHLNLHQVTSMVIMETFRNIKVLLNSDKGDANFSDRTLLKNLGHWLGMLTLAKNKPILQIDIDLKSLLYEAYHKGARELLYVVPFAAKVLESCAKSKVFRPPNPWTMGIMNVLAELHMEQDLKLNLKFEIEVLCKTLTIELQDLKPGNYLKDQTRLQTLELQLSNKPKIPISGPPVPVPSQPSEPVIGTTSVTPSVTSSTVPNVSTTTPNMPPRPQFSFDDINTSNFSSLANHIVISDQIPLFKANPSLRHFVKTDIEKSIQDVLPPVLDKMMKITLITCEQIIKKDFALDPEENRMRAAAHHMARNITAGLILITTKDALYVSISNNLKNSFIYNLRNPPSQQQKEVIEQVAQLIAQDNTELACAFVQKTVVEKVIPEIDKRLSTEYDLRKHARSESRRYCDPVVLTYQAERMPEQLRLKVGGVTPSQIAVYEEFANNIPGFLPTNEAAMPPGMPKPVSTQQVAAPLEDPGQTMETLRQELEQYMKPLVMSSQSNHPLVMQLQSLLEAVNQNCNRLDINSALPLLHKAVEGLLEHLTSVDKDYLVIFRDCHLMVIKTLHDRALGQKFVSQQLARILCEAREDIRYNLKAVECLIRNGLVNLVQYDHYMMQLMENGSNAMAVMFTMQLLQRLCVEDRQSSQITEIDFPNTIETLSMILSRSSRPPEGLSTLLDNLKGNNTDAGHFLNDRNMPGPTSMMQSGISQAREIDDPPGLHEKTEYLLKEWVTMYHSPAAGRDSTKAFMNFVQQMHSQGILKTDDLITRFFRLCTEMCVDLCYRALSEPTPNPALVRAKCFHTMDAFVRLIALLVKHSGDTNNTTTKINLLNKVLGIVAGVLLQDHTVRQKEFQQLPYHRIFIMLFIELNAPDHILENINYSVLTAFCNTFHVLRPAKAPGFAYAWLELISHRVFIGRMLALTPGQKGWGMYAQLLIDLFKFLAPFLRNAGLSKPTQLLYKGTLRMLLVLLHDFPEFLCDYHYAFCDVIPPNCTQMRNLILSAFPRNMRLPDPFTPNLKVDRLADIANPPRIITNIANMIQPPQFKKDLDSYLKSRSPVTFLSDLRSNLQSVEPGHHYNIPLMNALVLYVGTMSIQYIHSKGLTPSMSTIAHSSHMDIFQNLAVDLDSEGRYLFLTSIANQLRYPNSHTHYFSCTLLYLFAEANQEAIQEQITRVLLERLIVNRPHPWGLLITFIELIKNPQFKFWSHEFVHCAPEIEKVFESVARSCFQAKTVIQNPQEQQETQEIH